jgi:lipocalin
MRKALTVLLICIGISSCAQNNANMKSTGVMPIAGFELDRYLGRWYEIARYPHSFEKNLQGVTATYSMNDNGMVRVENAGYKYSLDGKFKTAIGKAKFAGDETVGHLKVSFFLFFYGDYIIMDLDEDYQWAVVGSSSPNYLWILSRGPRMDEALYRSLIDKIIDKGYDPDRLQSIEHDEQIDR